MKSLRKRAPEEAKKELVVSSLSCARGGRWIFQNLNFSIQSGHLLRVKGPNGAGKTSLLRALAGFLPVSQGGVCWDQKPLTPQDTYFLGIQPALTPALTVQENIIFWATLLQQGRENLEDQEELENQEDQASTQSDLLDLITLALQHFGLEEWRAYPVRHLSAGQKQRLSLTRLFFVQTRPVWLLDEPLNGLDDEGQKALQDLWHAHQKRGGVSVVASHLPLPASQISEAQVLDLTHVQPPPNPAPVEEISWV